MWNLSSQPKENQIFTCLLAYRVPAKRLRVPRYFFFSKRTKKAISGTCVYLRNRKSFQVFVIINTAVTRNTQIIAPSKPTNGWFHFSVGLLLSEERLENMFNLCWHIPCRCIRSTETECYKSKDTILWKVIVLDSRKHTVEDKIPLWCFNWRSGIR